MGEIMEFFVFCFYLLVAAIIMSIVAMFAFLVIMSAMAMVNLLIA